MFTLGTDLLKWVLMKKDQKRNRVFISWDWPMPNLLRSERERERGREREREGERGREREREGERERDGRKKGEGSSWLINTFVEVYTC